MSHIGRPAGAEVLAEARVLARDDEIFPAAVTLTTGGTVVAAASVTYRIVTP